jgi:hypothetical protein
MLIWQGRGGLVPLVTFIIALTFNLLADELGGKGYWDKNNWLLGIALLISSAIIFFVHLNTDQKTRQLIDQRSGERFNFTPKHTLFFIPMKWWSLVLTIMGSFLILRTLNPELKMESFSIWHWLIVILMLAIFVAPVFFYIRTYQNVSKILNSIGADAPTSSAWLLFIPIFSIIWFFVLLLKLRNAISATRLDGLPNTWWTYGIIAGVLNISLIFTGGLISEKAGAVNVIIWIAFAVLHWVELASLRAKIEIMISNPTSFAGSMGQSNSSGIRHQATMNPNTCTACGTHLIPKMTYCPTCGKEK